MLRIIGIDPGSRMTGYGLIDTDGMHSVYLSHGVIKLSGEPLPPRLGEIFATISGLIQEHQPDVMAIEQVFVRPR
ncbi:MAG: crossover junction endodeoxyribonuclease RuvC [Candidatus Thiodiazotropha endolucinida]